ncbi:hypothetical protein EON79_10330, partial [bacterium]
MLSRSLPLRRLLLSLLALVPALASAQQIMGFAEEAYHLDSIPYGLGPVTQLSAGGQHVLAVKRDGTVSAWGSHIYGENNVPAGLSGVVGVAAGNSHSLALKSNGTVVGWGDDQYGQATIPAGLSNVVQIAAGLRHSVALKSDGTVVAWGGNGDNQCTIPPGLANVVQIAAGGIHTMALKSDGTVVAWGSNNQGQRAVPAGLNGVVQISGGYLHSMALKSDGTVVAWGWNSWSQSVVPAGLTGVVQVAAGGNHSLALKANGQIVGWGRDTDQQSSGPSTLPPARAIVAGGLSSFAVLPAGVDVDLSSIHSGGIATGQVTLVDAPGAGGATFALSAEDPAVHVPPTVFVPAGAYTATFPVSTDTVVTDRKGTHVYAIRAGTTYSTTFDLARQSGSLILTQTSVIGGSTSQPALYVYLGHTSDVDVTLDLASSDPKVTLPAQVTIPAGQWAVRISPQHALTAATQTVTLTSSYMGTQFGTIDITLRPITGTLTFIPTEVVGGTSTTGYLQLNAALANPLTVALANGDATKLGLPASVKVAKGDRAAYFPVTSTPVDRTFYVPVTATVNGKAITTKVKVVAGPTLTILNVPTYAYGNQVVSGSVVLREPAPAGGANVALSASGPISVPASVFVPAGMSEASFPITTTDVAMNTNGMVTATGGQVTISKPIEVRPVTVAAISLTSYSVTAGTSVTGKVTLPYAVQSDTVIQLTSQFPTAASVPATMTIMAGSKTGTFTVATFSPGATAKNVKITASKNGSSQYR